MMDPLGTKKRKQKDILRGVYEDNLRISDSDPLPDDQERRGFAVGILALMLLSVIVGGGFFVQYLHAGGSAGALADASTDTFISPVTTGAGVMDAESLSVAASFRELASVEGPSLAALFGLEIQTVVLDAGHGGRDPGAIGVNGAYEKDVALDVAVRLKDRLERHGLRVLMTRTGDVKVPLSERAAYANTHQADLFISVHVNTLPDASVASVETYYFGAGTDARARQLARHENRGSDYSIADFRRIIDRLENTLRLQESRRLASSIQSNLFTTLHEAHPALANWGVKTAPFVVLLGAEAPGILTEVGVLSNAQAEERLQTEKHREHIAAALEQGVIAYLRDRALTQTSFELAQHTTHHGR